MTKNKNENNKNENSIYSVPEVAQACERAARRAVESGEDWCVYVNPNTMGTWVRPSCEPPLKNLLLVFDTADGGRLL